jgi:hypothetical protein
MACIDYSLYQIEFGQCMFTYCSWVCVLSACFESWACISIQFPVLRAVCMLSACASRAGRVCACICTYWGLSVCPYLFACTHLHVSRAKRVFARDCLFWEPDMFQHMSEYIEGWECGCMRLNLAKAESVPACVCACLESGIFLHLSRADQVSLYVGHYQELSMCACFQSNVICCERNTDTTAICRNRIQLSKQDKYTWISINMYMYVYVYMFAKYLWKCDEDHPNDGKVMYACLCTWVPFQVLI